MPLRPLFILFGMLLLLSPSWVQADDFLSSVADIEQYVSKNQSCSMEDVLAKLSPDLKKNYSLVYESRSPIGATLETPRVILMNKDASVMLSFAGSSDMSGGHQLEIIERGDHVEPFRFKRIDFSKPVSERIEHAPTSCMACHSIHGSKLGLRPIWDTYPDWPGAYGSSHSGKVRGNIFTGQDVRGTSTMPILEFEKDAFEKFKKNAANQPRYQILENLKNTSLEQLAENNTAFTDQIAKSNAERLKQIFKNLPAETSLEKYVEIENTVLQGKYAVRPNYQRANDGIVKYYDSKRKRIQKIVKVFGSANDKAAMIHNLPTASIDPDTVIYLKKHKIAALTMSERPVGRISLISDYIEKEFSIDPSDLSYTREAGSFAFDSGFSGGHLEQQLKKQILKSVYDKIELELSSVKTPADFIKIFGLASQTTAQYDPLILKFSEAFFKAADPSPIDALNALFQDSSVSVRIKRYFVDQALARPYSLEELKNLKVPSILDEGYNSRKAYFKRLGELSSSTSGCFYYYLRSVLPNK